MLANKIYTTYVGNQGDVHINGLLSKGEYEELKQRLGVTELPVRHPPISPSASVVTVEPNRRMEGEWTPAAKKSRKWGVKGRVIHHHDSHGLCYDIRHEDGTVGSYDATEFAVLASAVRAAG